MSILSIDFETRATVDLRATGVYPYAAHPDTDIWCMAWAFDDEPPRVWTLGEPFSKCDPEGRVFKHILAEREIRAWNAQFERIIWREIMVKRYGAPHVFDEQWVCTAAEAAAMGLPRSLDQASKVLGVSQRKDTEGYNLMMRLTKPRKIHDNGQITWWDNAEGKLDRLYAYCIQDVNVERACARALRRLTPKERELYLLDQRINDRGVRLDLDLIAAAQAVAAEGTERANAALQELTGGAVTKVSGNAKILGWVRENGVETDSIAKPAMKELMESDLDPVVRQVLQIKADAGRTSVAKLASMLNVAGQDGRARGLLLYYGAFTGRWAGRLIQPQNFPRGEVKSPEAFIPLVLERRYDDIDLHAHPIIVISALLRSMLVADTGKTLIAGDFSAIEARVLNWLAGQDDVIDCFHQYDAGDKTMDPYLVMARRMGEGTTRQAGKAAELGCGFQMGPRRFISAAWEVYQVRVDKEQAKTAVKAYRASHNKVVDLWWETERAYLAAIHRPGEVQVFGGHRNLKAVVRGSYLYVILPSGRPLCYAAPKAVEAEVVIEDEDGEEKRFTKVGVEFSGVDPNTKQWTRQRGYGGYFVENIVQSVARDLMAEAMLRLDKLGFPVILSVHDEVVSEVGAVSPPIRDFERLLTEAPEWATGCPISAEAWSGPRYKK